MSYYYVTCHGRARTAATRTGSTLSGVDASVSSHTHKLTVRLGRLHDQDEDIFTLHADTPEGCIIRTVRAKELVDFLEARPKPEPTNR